LQDNYPNPFNKETKIKFSIPERCRVILDVTDIMGNKVLEFINHTVEADDYEVIWDGTDANGFNLPNGMYICRLIAGSHVKTIKMMLRR
jgi:flagellar hook assembly protein FlgD